jgi:uncharacterized protein (DUF849 family)
MKKKLIIAVALCGAGTTREQSPFVPLTPDEIAADTIACAKAGASIVHLHVRDKDGINSMKTELFVELVGKVRKSLADAGLDVVLNLTTSGSVWPEELRLGHLPVLEPEMCSYDPGTMNWGHSYVFLNPPSFLEKLGLLCQKLKIKPEIEIFDAGMIGTVDYYIKKGILKTPCHYQFVLNVPGGMPGTIESLSYLLPKIPTDATWSITGIGKSHVPMMFAGLAAGCDGLRVGLEDNVFMDKGVHATNVGLVTRACEFATLAGREIATAAEARHILGLTRQ